MPLITFCGHPKSGKSVRARLLLDFLKHNAQYRGMQTELISYETLKISRNEMYAR